MSTRNVQAALAAVSSLSHLCRLLPALLALYGCAPIQVGVDQPTRDAATDIASKVRDGLTKVSEGFGALDPAGVKRLLNENADLREKLAKIQQEVNAADGLGIIEIASRAIQIRVKSYTGAFTVNGWLDDKNNLFWFNRTFNKMDFSWGKTDAQMIDAIRRESFRLYGGNGDAWNNIAMASLSYTSGIVRDYLQTNTIVPGSIESIDLNTSLGGVSGQHTIFLEVTPTAVETVSGKWSISFETVLIRSGPQPPEVVRVYDLSSDQHAGHPLRQALPAIRQPLIVKVTQ